MQAKQMEKSSTVAPVALRVAATFTAEPVQEAIAFWMQELQIEATIEFAPYSQVFQQLLDPTSLLSQNSKGINIILLRVEDWERYEYRSGEKEILPSIAKQRIQENIRDLVAAIKASAERSATPFLVCFCPPSEKLAADPNYQGFFLQMEALAISYLENVSVVHIITPAEIFATYPVSQYYDPHTDELGHIPYTPVFFTAIGTFLARKIRSILTPTYKVIVLDCDQTLWKGVVGEDGVMGIEIDPPRKALQEFVVKQSEAGMLICLCSKNIEADVEEVFQKRSDMPLKRENIVSWRINWQAKSTNIIDLAKELNLGLDSFIFIDDNPVECAAMRATCPQVLTLQLPEPDDIPRFLKHLWAFDRLKVTEEDKKRTALYQQNAQREQLKASSLTLESFLENLGLEINLSPLQPNQLARVSQLTLRTNQFNFTTIRRSESEIKQLLDAGSECLVAEVKDKFGDYGLVGVMIFAPDNNCLKLDTFLLSCRVLGRGVEHRLLAKLGEIATNMGLDSVSISYIRTAKNQPAFDFLTEVGEAFKQENNNGFEFNLPAKYVSEISYQPGSQDTTTEEKETPANPSTNGEKPSPVVENSARFNRIVTELYDPEEILKFIEAKKLQSRYPYKPDYIVPETELQKQLAAIWQQLLDVERVGLRDNFFSLGGDSLLVTQLIFRVKEQFNIDLPEPIFFAETTLENQANIINYQLQLSAKITAERQEKLEHLLLAISQLSEEEAAAQLLEKRQAIFAASLVGKTAAEYYCCADIERITIGNNSELVYCRSSKKRQIISAETGAILQDCRQFKTLEEHAREIWMEDRRGFHSITEIKNQLSQLVNAGFLISQQQLIDKYRQQTPDFSSTTSIATLGIVTCNRVEGLQRSLTSYIENCQKYGRSNDFAIMDDSAAPETRAACKQMLRSLKNQYGVQIFYAGLEEKQKFAKLLIQKGEIPEEIVNFALFDVGGVGSSPGANRNALTLHTVGDTIFSADDDTVCRLVTSPTLSEGLTFTAGQDPSDYWLFSDRKNALESVTFVQEDLLALHEKILGKSLIDILSNHPKKPEFEQINSAFIQRLEAGNGKVLVTFNGLVGDCGWGAPFGYWGAPLGYLLLTGSSFQRLTKSETDYRQALTSREILRVVNRTGITDESFGMTTFVGLDNRNLLPPFMPVRRGQDLIFANTIGQCFNNGFFGHLPWALLHEPIEKRKFWAGEIFRTASGFDTSKLIITCLKSLKFTPNQATPEDKLRTLGQHLIQLGSASQADFEEFVLNQACSSAHEFITLAENRLKTSGYSPKFWANDVKKYINILCDSLTGEDNIIPLDLVGKYSPDQARILGKDLVFKFGQLLLWWPDIVQAAKQLRLQGKRLAVEDF